MSELMEIIGRIRDTGHMFSRHVITHGGGVIAMPLPKRSFGRILAVGVSGPVVRLDERADQIIDCMKRAIARFLMDSA